MHLGMLTVSGGWGKPMVNRERLLMRLILASYLVMLCVLSANAAPATIIPNAAPISLNIRTAGDLANACTIKPTNKVVRQINRTRMAPGFACLTHRPNAVRPWSSSPAGSEQMRLARTTWRAPHFFFMSVRFPCTG